MSRKMLSQFLCMITVYFTDLELNFLIIGYVGHPDQPVCGMDAVVVQIQERDRLEIARRHQ